MTTILACAAYLSMWQRTSTCATAPCCGGSTGWPTRRRAASPCPAPSWPTIATAPTTSTTTAGATPRSRCLPPPTRSSTSSASCRPPSAGPTTRPPPPTRPSPGEHTTRPTESARYYIRPCVRQNGHRLTEGPLPGNEPTNERSALSGVLVIYYSQSSSSSLPLSVLCPVNWWAVDRSVLSGGTKCDAVGQLDEISRLLGVGPNWPYKRSPVDRGGIPDAAWLGSCIMIR